MSEWLFNETELYTYTLHSILYLEVYPNTLKTTYNRLIAGWQLCTVCISYCIRVNFPLSIGSLDYRGAEQTRSRSLLVLHHSYTGACNWPKPCCNIMVQHLILLIQVRGRVWTLGPNLVTTSHLSVSKPEGTLLCRKCPRKWSSWRAAAAWWAEAYRRWWRPSSGGRTRSGSSSAAKTGTCSGDIR